MKGIAIGILASIVGMAAVSAPVKSNVAGDEVGRNGAPLPYDAEIEYLESTGTQWIDTGVKITADCLFDFAVAKTRSNYNCVFFGTRNSGNSASNNLQCYLNANDTTEEPRFSRITLFTTATLNTSNWTSGIVPVINQMYSFTGVYCVPTMQPAAQTMPLFAFKNINTFMTTNCACRIGHWKVYTQSEVLADFIPVRVGTVGYMYDRVSGHLFGNAGTGEFKIGPDCK